MEMMDPGGGEFDPRPDLRCAVASARALPRARRVVFSPDEMCLWRTKKNGPPPGPFSARVLRLTTDGEAPLATPPVPRARTTRPGAPRARASPTTRRERLRGRDLAPPRKKKKKRRRRARVALETPPRPPPPLRLRSLTPSSSPAHPPSSAAPGRRTRWITRSASSEAFGSAFDVHAPGSVTAKRAPRPWRTIARRACWRTRRSSATPPCATARSSASSATSSARTGPSCGSPRGGTGTCGGGGRRVGARDPALAREPPERQNRREGRRHPGDQQGVHGQTAAQGARV